MRSEQKVRELLARAQSQTSARAARVSLVVPKDKANWVILLNCGDEELAIEVNDGAEISDQELLDQIAVKLMRLF